MTDASRESSEEDFEFDQISIGIAEASRDLRVQEFGVYVTVCTLCRHKGPILYDVKDISAFFADGKKALKITENAIDTLIKQGKLRVIHKGSRTYLWADVLGAEDASD